MLCSFSFFVFTPNDLKQKIKLKTVKILVRQRFNNKIGYTLLTAETFDCTDIRFRSVLDTHSLTHAYM